MQLIAVAIASIANGASMNERQVQEVGEAHSRYSLQLRQRSRASILLPHNIYRDIVYRDAILYYTLYPASVIDTTSSSL